MLSPYRVLDLTTERGDLCGQILADLGADVIKVEPPGGSPARRIEPFFRDEPDPNGSLFWWAYNRNKRAVTLDLERDDGRALLRWLAANADFLIESYGVGYLAGHGLSYDELAAENPALIGVSITPFGQDGPKAGYADSDLVILAASGFLVLTGDDDRPPVRVSVPQAYLHAAAEGAVGALIALHERGRSGRGQHVDISAQQVMNQCTFASALAAATGAESNRRLSGGFRYGRYQLRQVFEAKDGHVAVTFLFGTAIGPFTRRLMEYVHEEGFCDEATRDIDWIGYGDMLMKGEVPDDEYERVKGVLETFTRTKTKAELLDVALERGLLVAPVATTEEVAGSEQLAARDYWRDVEHPELGERMRYPGPFARFSETPITYRRRPPLLGEHNREIYVDDLGLSAERLAELEAKGVV